MEKHSEKLPFIIAALYLCLILIISIVDKGLLIWDENVYLSNARYYLNEGFYIEPFRFPLLPRIISILWYFFGGSTIIAKGFIVLLQALSIIILYYFSKNYLKSTIKALFVTIGVFFNGLILFWSYRIYPDLVAMSLEIIFLWIIYKDSSNENSGLLNEIFIALIAVLIFLAKFTYAIIPGSYIIALLLSKSRSNIKKAGRIIALSVLFLAPWLISNYLDHGNLLWNFIEQYKVVSEWAYWESPYKLLINLIEITGITWIFSIIPPDNFKEDILSKTIYTAYIISLVFLAFGSKMKLERYVIQILPLMILISAKNRKISNILNIMLISFSVAFSMSYLINNIRYRNLCMSKDSFIGQALRVSKSIVNEGETIASNCCWVWFAYYLNTKSYYLPENTTYLMNYANPKLLIYSPNYGKRQIYGKLVYNYTDLCGNNVQIYEVS